MIEVKLLHELAAHAICPGNPEKVLDLIEARASRLHCRLIWINVARSVFGWVGALAAAGGLVVVANSALHSGEWLAQLFVAGGTATVMASWFSGRMIQRRKRVCTKHPYDIRLPKKIEQLLVDLASGRLRAMVPVEYGSVSTSALRSTDGLLFETELAPGTFTNRFAPILLLSDPKKYSSLWMPGWQTLNHPIYVMQETAEETQQIPEEALSPPQTGTHWIVRIPDAAYPGWQEQVLLDGPWEGLTQIEVGQILTKARSRALADVKINRKFNVSRFAKEVKTARLAAETVRRLLAATGKHDYDWVRKSAERLPDGNDQVR